MLPCLRNIEGPRALRTFESGCHDSSLRKRISNRREIKNNLDVLSLFFFVNSLPFNLLLPENHSPDSIECSIVSSDPTLPKEPYQSQSLSQPSTFLFADFTTIINASLP